ncbi:MAG: DUF1926 domain-containing protein [bacterium]|nr:MAG: DUF1926 domain-containing protein [bacterium]
MNTGSSDSPRARTTLLMGFHCHQPVGNFHSVLRQACATCYGPLLEELARFPDFRFGFHMSGYLLEWISEQEKGIHSVLAELASRGQAELLTAGFYEPILSVIPPEDALEQIGILSDHIRDISGERPAGLWLTERIWDPGLVPLLHRAGIRYSIVDDNHLMAAGLGDRDLNGYFITESRGLVMALYPISQALRYATPFKPVPEALAAIESAGDGAAIVFDDGEKFGLWPETFDWVYGKGWLRDFLEAVTNSETITTESFTRYLEDNSPLGRVYLPPGSYFEMAEWTLPPRDARLFHDLHSELERSGRGPAARRFLRGGLWPHFFIKYDESNNMHKKMIRISERTLRDPIPEARRHLLRGQCNDAYWHGIFGGLYLPVLRNSIKRELNEAERILDEATGVPGPRLGDLNADGRNEAEIRSADGIVGITSTGGQVYELSDKRSLFDLLGTLTRRMEHYHLAATEAREDTGEGVATIHEAFRSMDEETRRYLVYDRYPRYAFIDHFLPEGTGIGDFAGGNFSQWGDFADGAYGMELVGEGVRADRSGTIRPEGAHAVGLALEKTFTLDERRLRVGYRLRAEEEPGVPCVFACEINLHFPSATSCRAEMDGMPFSLADVADTGSGRVVSVRDPSLQEALTLELSRPAMVWSFPVQTVSQSEKGFDVAYQGSCLVLRWALDFAGLKTLSLDLTLAF